MVSRNNRADKDSASIEVDFIHQHEVGGSLFDRAAKKRAEILLLNIVNSILLIVSVSITFVLVMASTGAITISGLELGPAGSYGIYFCTSMLWLIASALIWLRFVFFEGWFLYPPSRPVDARRGDTKTWYDAVTRFVQDEPEPIALGLSKALRVTVRTKIKATNLFMWGIAILSSSLLLLITAVYSIIAGDFYDHAFTSVGENLAAARQFTLGIIGGEASSAELGRYTVHFWTTIVVFLPASLAAFIGFHVGRNAYDMRWSLLTTPDVLYKMLKHFLIAKNTHRDYLLEDVARDAKRLVKEYGIRKQPVDFIGMDGKLFFYDDLARSVFLQIDEGEKEISSSDTASPSSGEQEEL